MADKVLDGANKCLHTSHLSQPMPWSHMKRTMRIVPLVKYLNGGAAPSPSPRFPKATRGMKHDLCGTSLSQRTIEQRLACYLHREVMKCMTQ